MSLSTNITDLSTAIASAMKARALLVNGNAADLSALTTTTKTTLVAALNELKSTIDSVAAGTGAIADGSTGAATTWSSTKINAAIVASRDALVNGAPTALDTLQELAANLADKDTALGSIVTALDNRVRFDAAQVLSGPQQVQARANIGAGTGSSNLVIGTTGGTAADAAALSTSLAAKAPLASPAFTGTPTGITKSHVGLSAVDNTSDANKPVSTATATALTGKSNTGHTHASTEIADASTVGKAVLVAVDALTARTALGAGTSSLAIGLTSTTAKAGDYQPTAENISNASTIGRTVLKAATAAAVLTAIGAPSTTEVGSTTTDFVAVFNTGLA